MPLDDVSVPCECRQPPFLTGLTHCTKCDDRGYITMTYDEYLLQRGKPTDSMIDQIRRESIEHQMRYRHNKVYVVAKDHRYFDYFIGSDHATQGHRYEFVHSPWVLRRVEARHIVMIRGWQDRPDANELAVEVDRQRIRQNPRVEHIDDLGYDPDNINDRIDAFAQSWSNNFQRNHPDLIQPDDDEVCAACHEDLDGDFTPYNFTMTQDGKIYERPHYDPETKGWYHKECWDELNDQRPSPPVSRFESKGPSKVTWDGVDITDSVNQFIHQKKS